MLRSLIGFSLVMLMVSCKKDKPEDTPVAASDNCTIAVVPEFISDSLELDHTYSLNDSTDIQIVELKFYMSDVTSGGVVKKDNALFDYRLRGTKLFTMNGTPSGFTDFTALVGVPASQNHSDPSGFPENSMLSTINANDMYWGWSGGFIFVKIEAKADTIPDGIALFDHSLIYHVATDGFTENVSFPNLTWTQIGNSYIAKLNLDVEKIFNNPGNRIEVRTEHTTPHMPAPEGSLTEKVLDNFISALTAQ